MSNVLASSKHVLLTEALKTHKHTYTGTHVHSFGKHNLARCFTVNNLMGLQWGLNIYTALGNTRGELRGQVVHFTCSGAEAKLINRATHTRASYRNSNRHRSHVHNRGRKVENTHTHKHTNKSLRGS